MRTKLVKVKLYSFDELSDKAKDRVRDNYLASLSRLTDVFTDNCLTMLGEYFPNSRLAVQYEIGFSQSDGVNIYGELSLVDAVELIKRRLKKKEYRFMRWVLREFSDSIELGRNWRGCFCIADRYNYMGDIITDLENNFMRGIPYDTLKKINTMIEELMSELCGELLKDGYNFFCPEPKTLDRDIKEWAECFGHEFTANGAVFEGK